jgi:hypothetical protein
MVAFKVVPHSHHVSGEARFTRVLVGTQVLGEALQSTAPLSLPEIPSARVRAADGVSSRSKTGIRNAETRGTPVRWTTEALWVGAEQSNYGQYG